jgi:hypothetical protein
MPQIFISYIHEDEGVAQALRRLLEAKLRNVDVFVASDELRLGHEWLSKIRAALKSARVILALFSPAAIQRPWVNFEAGGAWFSDDKTLVPICIGGLSPASLPKPYSNIQGATFDDRGNLPYGAFQVPGLIHAALWYVVQDLWKILDLSGTSPAQFELDDPEVEQLNIALNRWNSLHTT